MPQENEPRMVMPMRPKSPPLAFQMTPNDALVARSQPTFPSQMPFNAPDYLTSSSATFKSDPYEISSPMEQDLHGQVRKQAEALRMQHQAFVVERECWEMERERLYRRIAALEGLLKSSKGQSPARSPVNAPFVNGNNSFTTTQHRGSSASATSRLPSIAEHDASPPGDKKVSFIKRDSAPKHISMPTSMPSNIPTKSVLDSFEDELEVKADMEDDLPPSPPATRQVLSPPPAEYRRDAGHTPLRMPSRPVSSDSATRGSALLDALEATPTRVNTERNRTMSQESDDDIGLSGPLRLPELPSKPTSENFTMEALTARLQYIGEHPDENQPLALTARSNEDSESDVDDSEMTVKVPKEIDLPPKETPSLSLGDTSAAEMSPPPASESSQSLGDQDFHDRGGIVLKKKTSINFGAPFGQLRM